MKEILMLQIQKLRSINDLTSSLFTPTYVQQFLRKKRHTEVINDITVLRH